MVVLGLLLAVAAFGLMVLAANPNLQLAHPAAAIAAAFIPYAAAAWVLVGAILLAARLRWLQLLAVPAAICAVVVVAQSWGPYWSHPAPSGTPTFSVMSLNTYYGWADVHQLVAEAERSRPSVVVLSEVTEATFEALQQTSWPQLFPNRIGEPAPPWHSESTMVFSSHPLELQGTLTGAHQQHVVRVDLPEGPVIVIAAHPTNPTDGVDAWSSELDEVGRAAQAQASLPVVVAGDLNAVREHFPLQRLLRSGLADAAEQAGAGWLPTFPTRLYAWLHNFPHGPAIPPLIALDHVLVNERVTAVSVRTFGVDGTDHLGLVAELRA